MTTPYTELSRAHRRELRRQSLLLDPGQQPDKLPNRDRPTLAAYYRRSYLTAQSATMARQYRECQDEIERLGGVHDPAVDAFSDDDITAKGGHYRPGMEALLRAVRDGRYDGVIVYEIPRALRNRRESLRFRQIFLDAGCDLYNVRFPMVSLYGPTAFVFDLLVDAAASEVEALSDRITSWHELMRKLGAARGPAPWGMTTRDSGMRIDGRSAPLMVYTPDEQSRDELAGDSRAEVVRTAVASVLAGGSARSVVTAWNQAGYPAPRGGNWTVPTVLGLLRSPTLAGLVHHRGQLLELDGAPMTPDSDGEALRSGDPLLDEPTWQQLMIALGTRKARPRSTVDSLLRGLVVCGTCGWTMVMQRDNRNNNSDHYRCQHNRSAAGAGACATGNSVSAPRLEELVTAAAVAVLEDPDLLAGARAANEPAAAHASAHLRHRLEQLNERLVAIEDLWLDTPLKDAAARARFDERRRNLETEVKAVTAELHERMVRCERPNAAALSGDVASAFAVLPRQQQTSVLLELIERIVIAPKAEDTRGWQPGRVDVIWSRD